SLRRTGRQPQRPRIAFSWSVPCCQPDRRSGRLERHLDLYLETRAYIAAKKSCPDQVETVSRAMTGVSNRMKGLSYRFAQGSQALYGVGAFFRCSCALASSASYCESLGCSAHACRKWTQAAVQFSC